MPKNWLAGTNRGTDRPLPDASPEELQLAWALFHDLKEPLRTISCCAEKIQRRFAEGDEDTKSVLSSIRQAAGRMSYLIEDALIFATVRFTEPECNTTDVSKLLESVEADLEAAIRESGAVITSDTLPVIMGDPSALGQVLENLLSNAIKYHGDERSRVHVGCTEIEGCWVFSVADNGIGIESRFHQEIFIPFKRLHSSQEYPGTGLGLAICRRIIERHGGRIWVQSVLGEGSTFYFTVPRIRHAHGSPREALAASTPVRRPPTTEQAKPRMIKVRRPRGHPMNGR